MTMRKNREEEEEMCRLRKTSCANVSVEGYHLLQT
jgi:hypothetical protein